MSKSVQFIILATLCAFLSNGAFAQSKKNQKKKKGTGSSESLKSDDSNGRGYTVAGAILTPVAASVGGTLLIVGLLNGNSCDTEFPSENSEETCEQSKIETYSGLAILTLGMGTGIYMSAKGRRMRRGFEERSSNLPEISVNWAANF